MCIRRDVLRDQMDHMFSCVPRTSLSRFLSPLGVPAPFLKPSAPFAVRGPRAGRRVRATRDGSRCLLAACSAVSPRAPTEIISTVDCGQARRRCSLRHPPLQSLTRADDVLDTDTRHGWDLQLARSPNFRRLDRRHRQRRSDSIRQQPVRQCACSCLTVRW